MDNQINNSEPDRRGEWFVPQWGPQKFRTFVGLLFLPYTGMVLSFTVIGSLLAGQVSCDRLVAIVFIYFFGLGVTAHALDALGSKGVKPWGAVQTPGVCDQGFQLGILGQVRRGDTVKLPLRHHILGPAEQELDVRIRCRRRSGRRLPVWKGSQP